jgi:hypothetical protein
LHDATYPGSLSFVKQLSGQEVDMTKKQRKYVRTDTRRQLNLEPLRIQVTNEEILADLRYPASRRLPS